jgi:hypothetical protein
VAVVALVTLTVWQQHGRAGLARESESLEQQRRALENDRDLLSNELAQASSQPVAQPNSNYADELARLRSEVETLRRQTNHLQALAAKAGVGRPRPAPGDPDQVLAVLPTDYPQTPRAATQTVLGLFGRGDADEFFRYFGQPGGKKMYDDIFANEHAKILIGSQVVSIGEPTTNNIDPSMWMVPYKLRLQDGSEYERELRLVQDLETKRWYFKGGL